MKTDATYPPLCKLKPIAPDVWVVDGPIIRFGPLWPKIPFPTRMTVVRLPGEKLLIHSPTPLPASLARDVAELGRPRWIIGPNRLHYWWIPEWHAAFPDAGVYLAPRIAEQACGRIDFPWVALDPRRGLPWDTDVATLAIDGSYMTEVVFFHQATKTLILTDLIENFERRRLGFCMRCLAGIGHALDPDGQMPSDLRMTFAKPALRAAVETLIAWRPERVVLAHGRWYERDGTGELRRAFRWLLPVAG